MFRSMAHGAVEADVFANNLHIFLRNTFSIGGLICFRVFGPSPKMIDDGGWSLLGVGVDVDTYGDGAELVDCVELVFLLFGAVRFFLDKNRVFFG